MPPDAFVFGMLVTRWDRPLRAMQFAASLDRDDLDALVIAGEPDVLVRYVARRGGWPGERVVRIGTWGFGERPVFRELADVATRLTGSRPRRIGIIGLENNHQYVADLIREKFLGRDVL